MYSGLPSACPRTPEGDFAELERMMSSSSYPTNRAVPLPSDHVQQIPILSAQSVNTSIPISHNPHEGPRNASHSGGIIGLQVNLTNMKIIFILDLLVTLDPGVVLTL